MGSKKGTSRAERLCIGGRQLTGPAEPFFAAGKVVAGRGMGGGGGGGGGGVVFGGIGGRPDPTTSYTRSPVYLSHRRLNTGRA